VLSLPFVIIQGVSLAAVFTYLIGLGGDLYSVFTLGYIFSSYIHTGEIMGMVLCTIFNHVGLAVSVTSAACSILSMIAGFVSLNIPDILSKLNYFSPLKWGAYASMNVAFHNQVFTCGTTPGVPCKQTGEEVLRMFGMTTEQSGGHGVVFHLSMLALVVTAYTIAAFLIIHIRIRQYAH